MHIIGTKYLISYNINFENGEKVITYNLCEKDGNTGMELAKIALEDSLPEDHLLLLQLLITPNAHNSLLASIIPIIEHLASSTEGVLQEQLNAWLVQTYSLLGPPPQP